MKIKDDLTYTNCADCTSVCILRSSVDDDSWCYDCLANEFECKENNFSLFELRPLNKNIPEYEL